MRLDLVDSGYLSSSLDQHLQHLDRAVGYSNSFDLVGLLVDPHDLFPSLNEGRSIPIDGSFLVIREWLQTLSMDKSDGPVNEPDVEVVYTELFEGSV